ncbi:MAG TPA: hypothetical protein VF503_30550 [Sphingobium sp.]|uniref:hypothetical protein n=1 Tax=Sphingobium sp. TaxID=1912891 RepID=UPI002ED59530
MTQPTCSTCRFRQPDTRPGYEIAGECRRYPPQIAVWTVTGHDNPSQPGFEQHWPWMAGDQSCGEYQARKETDPMTLNRFDIAIGIIAAIIAIISLAIPLGQFIANQRVEHRP